MRTQVSLLLSCLVLLVTFSGCAPASAPQHSAADLVLAAPAGTAAKAAQSAADAYAQATGRRARVETFTPDAYFSRIPAGLLAGTGTYDLVYLPAESLPKWIGYHVLQPLDLPVDENTAPWLPLATVDGETYGVPVAPDVDVLWYRKDLFEAAGISTPAGWDEALDAARALNLPLALAGSEMDAGRSLAALLGQAAWIEPGSAGWFVDENALAQALSMFAQLGGENAANWTRADAQNALREGQAAMAVLPLSSAETMLECEQSPDVCKDGAPLLAFASLPGMDGSLGVGTLQAWAVPLKAPHPQAAREFAAWLASAEGARAWASGGGLPAHRSALAEIDSQAAVGESPEALAAVESFRPAFPLLIPADAIWKALNKAGHAAVEGQPPEALAEELAQSIAAALRQSGYTVEER